MLIYYESKIKNLPLTYQIFEQFKNSEKIEIQQKIDKAVEEQDYAEEHNNNGGDDKKAKEIAELQESSLDSSEKSLNIDDSEDIEAVDNNEANMLDELQENLKRIKELEDKIINLNEKLSVCYTKEAQQEDLINSQKATIKKLSENSNKVNVLNNHVSALNEKYSSVQAELNEEQCKNSKLHEKLTNVVEKYNKLVDVYNDSITALEKANNDNKVIKEALENTKKDLELKQTQYSKSLDKSNLLIEKYKKVANSAANRYIESQALRIGVKPQEIKNKLSEKYTFDEIDSICEDLQTYKLNVSKLPFQTNRYLNESTIKKVDVTPSKNESLIDLNDRFDGDDVTDLLKIIQIPELII